MIEKAKSLSYTANPIRRSFANEKDEQPKLFVLPIREPLFLTIYLYEKDEEYLLFCFTVIAFSGKDTPRYNRQALCRPDPTDRYHTENPYHRAAAEDYYTRSAHDDW